MNLCSEMNRWGWLYRWWAERVCTPCAEAVSLQARGGGPPEDGAGQLCRLSLCANERADGVHGGQGLQAAVHIVQQVRGLPGQRRGRLQRGRWQRIPCGLLRRGRLGPLLLGAAIGAVGVLVPWALQGFGHILQKAWQEAGQLSEGQVNE